MIIETQSIRLLITKSHDAKNECFVSLDDVIKSIEQTPAVATYCDECKLHNNCKVEDAFRKARIEKPFCCMGKYIKG